MTEVVGSVTDELLAFIRQQPLWCQASVDRQVPQLHDQTHHSQSSRWWVLDWAPWLL